MNISIASLGCRLNQAELQAIITVLKKNGHHITKPEDASIHIVNTCVVTHTSERKTRKLIYRAQRHAGQSGYVFVTGCFSEHYTQEGHTFFVSNDYKHLIPRIIENGFVLPDNDLTKDRFGYSPATEAMRTRINLKIQDGCENFCSYCIIPHVRGGSVSKPLKDVIDEFKILRASGYKEFLFTGVMISNYRDKGLGLVELTKEILAIGGEYRLHFSSLSPSSISNDFIELFHDKRIVRHLNLSLQSGSNEILESMNRHYTAEDYISITERLKAIDPLFNFTTDLIVGFPGESEKNFEESVALVKEVGFSHIHTFRYSVREGTAAASMKDSVSEEIKKERSKKIIALYSEQKKEYYKKFDGKTSTLLTEKSHNGRTNGYNEYYIPCLINNVHEKNRFIPVLTSFSSSNAFLSASSLL